MDLAGFIALGVFILSIILISTGKIDRSTSVLLGASSLMVFRIIPAEIAVSYIDFNTIGLLIGMMIIVGVLARSGVFEYVAVKAIKLTRGNGFLILFSVSVVTALMSALLDNVTTVLLISPVVISLVDLIGMNPLPLLISEALASNIGGTATLIGDPPNMIVGSFANFSFSDFIINLSPLVILVLLAVTAYLAWVYRKEFFEISERRDRLSQVEEGNLIKNEKILKRSMTVMGFVLVGFMMHQFLHVEASVIALLGAACLLAVSPVHDPEVIQKDIEWPTLIFFAGLFMIVGALKETGVVSELVDFLSIILKGRPILALLTVLWFSGLVCIFVNNVAFAAIFVHVISDLSTAIGVSAVPLYWALAIGACFGGNGSFLGAAANVVVADVANKSGFPISFTSFMKIGIQVVLISLAISSVYVMLRYRQFIM